MQKKIIIFGSAIILLVSFLYAAKVIPYVSVSKCVGCGDCISVCPTDAITIPRGKAVIDPEKCIGCKICIYICSYGAMRE